MMNLEHWTYEREEELMDRRYKPAKGTGIKVRVWGGWKWEQDGREYRTNGEGEGLWRWMGNSAEWKQVRGTCEFGLPENKAKAIKALAKLGFSAC